MEPNAELPETFQKHTAQTQKKLNLSEWCYKRAMASFLTGNDSWSVLVSFNWHWQKRKYDRRSRVSWEATLSGRHATLRLSIPQSSGGISWAAVERCSPTELHLPVFLPEKLTNAHMCNSYKFTRSCAPLGITAFNFILCFNNPFTLHVCFFKECTCLEVGKPIPWVQTTSSKWLTSRKSISWSRMSNQIVVCPFPVPFDFCKLQGKPQEGKSSCPFYNIQVRILMVRSQLSCSKQNL